MIKNIKTIIKSNYVIKKMLYYRQIIRYKFYPEKAIKKVYRQTRGKEINLVSPKTLSEKLTYINLYSQHELATQLSDKYAMRDYIKNHGYENLLVELIDVYNDVDEIKFDLLPERFVLKCTHGCGYNIICKNKNELNIKKVKKQLNRWLNENFAYCCIEKHYENIKPKIICEKYIEAFDSGSIIDYKMFCINGKVQITQCCSDRENELKLSYYDINWKKLDYSNRKIDKGVTIKKPNNYNQMLEVATKLSSKFKFVRVDFYETKEGILLGELTFTPAACNLTYLSEKAEIELGNLLNFGI